MLISTVITIPVLLLVVNLYFYLQQPRMVFFPLKEIEQTPDQWGMHYEKVSLKSTHGNQIAGWYIPGENPGRVLLFFHGNGGNMSHRGDSLKIFHHLGL